MKTLLLAVILLTPPLAPPLQGRGVPTEKLVIEVSNPSGEYREQIVEVPLDSILPRLGLTAQPLPSHVGSCAQPLPSHGGFTAQPLPSHVGEGPGVGSVIPLRVRDAAGLDVPYQISHDGHLLVEAGVRKGGVARFTISKGVPQTFPTVCHGQLHPERKDDFAWENDRGAYRVYGPALERTGERSFGIDVWTKNTPELVVDDRFYIEDVVTIPRIDSLYRNDWHTRDSLYRLISYHYDHGRGLDPYRVGPSLGCGAPALLLSRRLADGSEADSIVMPYCFERFEVLDEGPLRFAVRLDQSPRIVQGDTIREHRIIQLDKGSNFCRMTVWYDGLSSPGPCDAEFPHQGVSLCAGVVLQSDDPDAFTLADDYVAYTDPTDQPDVHQAPLYVAVLFPYGDVATRRLHNHALGITGPYDGRPYTYYFGSAWSKYDVRTPEEWQARIQWFLRTVRQPLQWQEASFMMLHSSQ